MSIETFKPVTQDEVEALRKDIIVAINGIQALPPVPVRPRALPISGEVILEKVEPEMSKSERGVRNVAIVWIGVCVISGLTLAGAVTWEKIHEKPVAEKISQVGSIEVDYDVPVWVDPDLGN